MPKRSRSAIVANTKTQSRNAKHQKAADHEKTATRSKRTRELEDDEEVCPQQKRRLMAKQDIATPLRSRLVTLSTTSSSHGSRKITIRLCSKRTSLLSLPIEIIIMILDRLPQHPSILIAIAKSCKYLNHIVTTLPFWHRVASRAGFPEPPRTRNASWRTVVGRNWRDLCSRCYMLGSKRQENHRVHVHWLWDNTGRRISTKGITSIGSVWLCKRCFVMEWEQFKRTPCCQTSFVAGDHLHVCGDNYNEYVEHLGMGEFHKDVLAAHGYCYNRPLCPSARRMPFCRMEIKALATMVWGTDGVQYGTRGKMKSA
ncbi:hypothetical protein BJ742DRAFT_194438 [Cladochytrium replicatum]|nr:hypothetical protein BJ742DRAFT_194438 [Cladochytrium replicatum]